MDLIFNELSGNILANDEKEADQWMLSFFSIANTLSVRLYKSVYIRTTTEIKGLFIAPNYTFGLWLHTLKDRDYVRKILLQLTYKPLLTRYPYYYYQKKGCDGLGIAYEQSTFSISYPKGMWPQVLKITKESFDVNNEVLLENAEVNNLGSEDDVESFYPRLIFEHHKKHDNRRSNLNDGESTLHYKIPEEQKKVQKLLDCSFGPGKLFTWDDDLKMFVEFQHTGGNVYHGYHIEEDSRVPNDVKKQIDNFKKL